MGAAAARFGPADDPLVVLTRNPHLLAALRRVLQQQGGDVTAVAATPPAHGVLFRLDFARAS